MNHAYGVKHYVLKEEAPMPSSGFKDTLVRLKAYTYSLSDWAPWSKKINWEYNLRNVKELQ